ncbi:MAG: ribonuclease HII [Bacteroidales bacterium]|nr:ribonuclease HII [Bacteroidales bacterium]
MLKAFHTYNVIEAGCDEAGRGCLAGPVFAAAVILPSNFNAPLLNDSKKLTVHERNKLRLQIENEALAWAVGSVDNREIDEINILNASFLAMHRALDQLKITPRQLLIDGNRFKAYKSIKHICIVNGDATYASIAAASILAKTHRDAYMEQLHSEYRHYAWITNKGYPTPAHKKAIAEHGISPYHRKSFRINEQMKLDF